MSILFSIFIQPYIFSVVVFISKISDLIFKKKMIYVLCVGLILKSAFDTYQTATFFNYDSRNLAKNLYSHLNLNTDNDFVARPSSLMYHDGCNSHRFLHYNYVMFHSYWGNEEYLSFQNKVDLFKELSIWLNIYNITLKAYFDNNIDCLAWHIADNNDEYHFD